MTGPREFSSRHIGPSPEDMSEMLAVLGAASLETLVEEALPAKIQSARPLALKEPRGEHELLRELTSIAGENKLCKSFIGMGYYASATPPVILRNILENPGWYTQYTPYQAEISQGRLEALLNFQTMVSELCGLPIANASLLDEATAAAEAMVMCRAASGGKRSAFFASDDCHPQVLAVLATRARALGIELHVGCAHEADFAALEVFGVLLSYPSTKGSVRDPSEVLARARAASALSVLTTDLLALCLLRSPGELLADIAVGSAQRFGMPLGCGGPHAAFLATTKTLKRLLPGRVVGVSRDFSGAPALRLALQTREQHIRRDKATSNICTAQALPAIVAGMYAVYHGPRGLLAIAEQVHGLALRLAATIARSSARLVHESFFDTLHVHTGARRANVVLDAALARGMNLRRIGEHEVGVAFDELATERDVQELTEIITGYPEATLGEAPLTEFGIPPSLRRAQDYLQQPVFNSHHCETAMLRNMHRLAQKDLSLDAAMIPLGSCTMKLNGTAAMLPLTWPRFAEVHPFAPDAQQAGYRRLEGELTAMLGEICGLPSVSLQPNAGSQGEYAGLLVIRRYHEERGEGHRRVCLIPRSAHGTNPASAAMAGLTVEVIACDAQGNVDVEDLRQKARAHREDLAALMITYPSTHGVFEGSIVEICEAIHEHGGLVYMDGANMNALVGLARPGELGADVCHLNLHKTFALPHGGGGPGAGPIAVTSALAPFLPRHPLAAVSATGRVGAVAAAPLGNASILPIAWMYLRLLGGAGLLRATEVAILNANYMAQRLDPYFPVLYRGPGGRVAHELIIDLRPAKALCGVEVDDVAKRLMDYGFHAPTMSWPVAGTMMIEPTESEPKVELDRFCDAMIAIHGEIQAIARGEFDRALNPLKLAPHTAAVVSADTWNRPYPRALGALATFGPYGHKYWPPVGRVDNAYGDRNLVCTC